MDIVIKNEFRGDSITREAGERLRKLIVEGLNRGDKVRIDFTGCVIASTSFFDEGLAKLALEEVDAGKIEASLSVTNLNPRDRELLMALCRRRNVTLRL